MKFAILLFAVCLCGFVCCYSAGDSPKTTDPLFPKKQKDVLLVLKNINQPSYYPEFVDIAKTYSIAESQNSYINKEAVDQFLEHYENGFLPKGEIFSIFYQEHLEQAIALFKIFYCAKDYETFHKTAVWAREHLNEGMFLYSYIVAVVHRPDTQRVVLPPIYEVYPYYFFSTEVIQQAYNYKQQHSGQSLKDGGYTIIGNYSGYYLNLHPEQSLSYYLEDVGISTFYYFYNIYYPFWMSGEEFDFKNVNRGEQYYFLYEQLLARYYLERVSNGFGEIPNVDIDVPIETPYYPSLEYPNGLEFPSRPKFANVHEYFYNYGQRWSTKSRYGFSYSFIKDYSRRIVDAIDYGVVYSSAGEKKIDLYTPEGFNILGNIIQSNPDSTNSRYVGPIWLYASHLLGYSYQPLSDHKLAPSALEHFETAPRDPMFYQLYKKIVLKFLRYKSYLPAYTKKELVFPGVTVTDFDVEKLVTYNDHFYADLSNAVYYNKQELKQQTSFPVRVKQYRLNNKPFTYKVNVKSDKATKAVVKIFLGPKYDEYGRYINMTENRLNMVVLDYFVQDLQSGENVITRNSYDSYFYGPDPVTFSELYETARNGVKQDEHANQQHYFFYPRRFMLPIGSKDGLPYQFYVIVYPYAPKQGQQNEGFESYFYPYEGEKQFIDSYALGYPFDRFIKYEKLFNQIPNSYFHEAKIYYQENVNVV